MTFYVVRPETWSYRQQLCPPASSQTGALVPRAWHWWHVSHSTFEKELLLTSVPSTLVWRATARTGASCLLLYSHCPWGAPSSVIFLMSLTQRLHCPLPWRPCAWPGELGTVCPADRPHRQHRLLAGIGMWVLPGTAKGCGLKCFSGVFSVVLSACEIIFSFK